MHLAAASGFKPVYDLLRAAGARDDVKDFQGQTAAAIAAQTLRGDAKVPPRADK